MQQEVGFSQFGLEGRERSFLVGRLGEHYFRLTEPAAWDDPGVHAALRGLDPQRPVLLLAPHRVERLSPVRHTERLQVDLDTLRQRLLADAR
jgi:hypothetical protein